MELTQPAKDYIDSLSYEGLLAHWRFAKIGDPWFDGATGEYWAERMRKLRQQPGGEARHIYASKKIGWEE